MAIYKVCRENVDGSYKSVSPPANARLTYALNEKTEALRNTPGIFCFSNLQSAQIFARRESMYGGMSYVVFMVETIGKKLPDIKELIAPMDLVYNRGTKAFAEHPKDDGYVTRIRVLPDTILYAAVRLVKRVYKAVDGKTCQD